MTHTLINTFFFNFLNPSLPPKPMQYTTKMRARHPPDTKEKHPKTHIKQIRVDAYITVGACMRSSALIWRSALICVVRHLYAGRRLYT